MQLTVDQMLQQGAAAHNAGNLGLIAVSMNQSGVALPLFKSAIDVNPNREQFWLSYIEALITERQFKNAKQAIKKGTKKGLAKNKLHALKQNLASVKAGKAPLQTPSQAELNSLLEHYQNGRYDDAEKMALLITQEFPKNQFAWKVLGALLRGKGMKAEALNATQKAVQLVPQDAYSHNNLGITLQELGRLEEAEASYRQAIALKSDYVDAHNNLGITLQDLGRLEEAEASCRQAIALKPDYAKAHNNLGNTLQELGRLEEAEASLRQAIGLKTDFAEAHNNLGITLQELGRLEEAEASCRQAIALKSDYAEAHYNLGGLLMKIGQHREGLNEQIEGSGIITFDLKDGLSIL